jgi:hypothetical protein
MPAAVCRSGGSLEPDGSAGRLVALVTAGAYPGRERAQIRSVG